MPIYPIKCQKCNHEFELVCTFKDRDNASCPECGSKELTSMVAQSTFKLKGNWQH
jgi:putative FmdB family regulatory protein